MWTFSKMNNFKNIVYSCIISSVCIVQVLVHIRAKYEGFKLNHVVRRATQRNQPKWLCLINFSCAYIRTICACMCKIRSFCGQEDCPQTMTMTQDNDTPWTIHDYIGSSANEPTRSKTHNRKLDEIYTFRILLGTTC